ncbi:MAG: hypothetical protein IPJ43_15380 [Saprospiraceae bacterium]|nr:hypothetical protein [Saprospiraceae bacterium]
MQIDYFLITERIKQIETTFIKDGWLTIYELTKDDFIYCCLVLDSKIGEYKTKTDWKIRPYAEGKPTIDSDGAYKTYSEDGYEPFIFAKHFKLNNGHEEYLDISEEFILYFKLYERAINKQNRKYFFIDELGDLEEVIEIEPNKIRIKLKYLKEYIAIRQVHFAVCFDFMRVGIIDVSKTKIEYIDKDFKGENYIYNHLIRPLDGKFQSWIFGKKIISFDPSKTKCYHFDNENQIYESFITGYDENGNEVYLECGMSNEKHFVVTYFKKDVLNKYYNEPLKYEVNGWYVKSNFFMLKIDNNNDDYVAVFLIQLGYLPYKEQLHWKHYNIQPQKGISTAYYQTMIEGNWVDYPETPDLFFKHKFEQFNKKWEAKFGWQLYKALAKEDEYLFKALHIPTSNNVKSFCEQILSIIKITIDRLNEAELTKQITLNQNDKGITKLEKFLANHQIEIPDMIIFLRHLWNLRSGLLAHSFSNSNDKCKKAIQYFKLSDDNYIEVARDIFIKSIFTLNTFESKLLSDESCKLD